jgi:hypothetical protein
VTSTEASVGRHPLLVAVQPVADALGAQLVEPGAATGSDIPLEWDGTVVGALRLPVVPMTLPRLIDGVERELGGRLGDLSREDKQRAVRMLEERGAFMLRRAVDDVADALGVSRITVYNYLNAMRSEPVRHP